MYSYKKFEEKLNKEMGNQCILYEVNDNKREWDLTQFVICSIDPGKVNFALRIEERKYLKINENKYKFIYAKPIYFEFITLVGDKNCYTLLSEYFDSIFDFIKVCNIFIIEKQLVKNYKCVRINQHIISYLLLKLKDSKINPLIYDIESKLKYSQFNVKKLMERERKKRSVDIAIDLLTKRKDQWSIDIICNNRNKYNKSKKDDLADVVIQIEAFMKYNNMSDYMPPLQCTVSDDSIKILNEYIENSKNKKRLIIKNSKNKNIQGCEEN